MTARIVDGCIGCGMCAGSCPEVFRMTDDGIAQVYNQPAPEDENNTQLAADNCPVSVICIE